MLKKWWAASLSLLLPLSLIAGCSGGTQPAEEAAKETAAPPVEENDPDPITLTLYANTNLFDGDFEKFIEEPLKEQFPHITLQKIDSGDGRRIQDLINANEIPDIIWEGLTNINRIIDLELPADLDPLVEEHGFDLERLDPQVVKSIRSYSENEELFYLPFRVFSFALHYNKDIFDLFGVDYPKENLTWDEAVDLAKQLSRTEGGVTYRGLHSGISVNRMQTQLSLPYVDPETNEPVLESNEGWRKLYQTFKSIYELPGAWPDGEKYGNGRNAFLGTKNLAMFPHLVMIGDEDFIQAVNDGMNIGLTTFPEFADNPGVGPGVFSDGFVIPQTSKNIDAAFEVVSYLLSDEVQSRVAKLGNPTALNNPDIQNELYADHPLAQEVDFTSIYNQRFADPYPIYKYENDARTKVQNNLVLHFTGQLDLNTALRQANEELKQLIAEKNE